MIQRWIQPARFTAARGHDPQMRSLGVRREIDIFTVEHKPFAIRRRHWRTDPLEFRHVFKRERVLLRRRGRLSESRKHHRERQRQNLPMHDVYVALKRATNPGGSASPKTIGKICALAPDLTSR